MRRSNFLPPTSSGLSMYRCTTYVSAWAMSGFHLCRRRAGVAPLEGLRPQRGSGELVPRAADLSDESADYRPKSERACGAPP
jgi:hypothetical protein